jgi:hypothetical protein
MTGILIPTATINSNPSYKPAELKIHILQFHLPGYIGVYA